MHNRLGHRFQRRLDLPVWLERGPQGQAYIDKILGIQSGNLIAYWPLREAAGVVAENIEGTVARNGTYARDVSVMGTQDGIGDGNTAPTFDGANDVVDIYSASLAAAWDQSESSVMIWLKPDTWAGGVVKKFFRLFVDANNTMKAEHTGASNNIETKIENGAVNEFQIWAAGPSTDWQTLIMTNSQANDRAIVYGNGINVAQNAGLGVWAGPLSVVRTLIGADTQAAGQSFLGSLSHMVMWVGELTPDEALVASTV